MGSAQAKKETVGLAQQLQLPVPTQKTNMSVRKRDSTNSISFLALDFSANSTKEGSKNTPQSRNERSNSIMNSVNLDTESHLSCENHRDIMTQRWLKVLEGSIPEQDFADVKTVLNDPREGRQFAPEYSQCNYNEMLVKETKIGNYIKDIN
jgi:hypothetical protein